MLHAQIVRDGNTHIGEKWRRPNTHGLLELATKTLPAFRNGRFVDTSKFETHHKPMKQTCKGARSGKGGRGGEHNSIKWCLRKIALRHMLLGLSWGEHGEFALSPALLALRDTRKGKEHLPFPLWLSSTKLLPLPKRVLQANEIDWWHQGNIAWVPRSLGKLRRPADDDQAITPHQFDYIIKSHNIYYPKQKISLSDIEAGCRVHSVGSSAGHRTLLVRENDDIEIQFDEDPAWCTVNFLFGVVVQHKGYLWLSPVWYDHPKPLRGRRKPKNHPVTGAVMLEKCPAGEGRMSPPVPCQDIVQQVIIKHSCVRAPLTGATCAVRAVCRLHDAPDCRVVGCMKGSYRKECHNRRNISYEVIDRSVGFTTSSILAPFTM